MRYEKHSCRQFQLPKRRKFRGACQTIYQGAKEAGNAVQTINLSEIGLKYCIGCLSCQKTGKCVLSDDINALLPLISDADVLVFASPIYYYSICGQLKTFLDRLNPLYGRKNKFKEIYLLLTAAESDFHAADGAIQTIQGFLDCFPGTKLSEIIFGGGADDLGTIQSNPAFAQAYEAGKAAGEGKQET